MSAGFQYGVGRYTDAVKIYPYESSAHWWGNDEDLTYSCLDPFNWIVSDCYATTIVFDFTHDFYVEGVVDGRVKMSSVDVDVYPYFRFGYTVSDYFRAFYVDVGVGTGLRWGKHRVKYAVDGYVLMKKPFGDTIYEYLYEPGKSGVWIFGDIQFSLGIRL